MRLRVRADLRFCLVLAILPLALPAPSARAQAPLVIGGEKVVTLTRAVTRANRPEFTSVTLLPGRGMQILQIVASFPGRGAVDVLAAPDVMAAKKMLDDEDNANGNMSYRFGAAFLAPYANRIRGRLSPDGGSVLTAWQGHPLSLPANTAGRQAGAERCAMHGLILKARAEDLRIKQTPGGEQAVGVIHAGSFGGHWLSKTDLVVTVTLTAEAVDVSIVAHNVGSQPEPMAIGWHPYFNLPSGNRAQARVLIPGAVVAQVDNYDNVFPTGRLLPVAGTRYDLRAPGGQPLAHNFFDDNWSQLGRRGGAATVRVIDPAARYGISIEGLSPQIQTIQMYAPPDSNFVAIEHQYNFANPFGREWGGMDTGMVTLNPGQSTRWQVRLHVFAP